MNTLITALTSNVWAMDPGVLRNLQAVILRHVAGEKLPQAEVTQVIESRDRRRAHQNRARVENGVAVIPISGVIHRHSSLVSDISQGPGTSVDAIADMLDDALSAEDVRGIVLDVDSPGGSVQGVDELAEAIYDARQQKPVYAHVDGTAASAAYWLASQAEKVFSTRSSVTGGLGVYASVVDDSRKQRNDGLDTFVVSSGKSKGAVGAGEAVGVLEKEEVARGIEPYRKLFVERVAMGRNVDLEVAESWADGRTHIGEEAAALGLIDGVANFRDVVRTLAEEGGTTTTQDIDHSVSPSFQPGSPNRPGSTGGGDDGESDQVVDAPADDVAEPAEEAAPDPAPSPAPEPAFERNDDTTQRHPGDTDSEPTKERGPSRSPSHSRPWRKKDRAPRRRQSDRRRETGPTLRTMTPELLAIWGEHGEAIEAMVDDAVADERERVLTIMRAAVPGQEATALELASSDISVAEAVAKLSSDPNRLKANRLSNRRAVSEGVVDPGSTEDDVDPERRAFENDPQRGDFASFEEWQAYRAAMSSGRISVVGMSAPKGAN